EDGTVTTVDVPSDIVNQFENIVKDGPVTVDGDTYNTIEEYIQHIVETNESVTTLVNNNDGTYTYTSEDGTVTTVDVPADIANQFENIVKDGPVTVDGDTYNTIEEYIQHIVETNESVTTLVNNNDGTYTYTSEDGTVTVVDVPSDIVNQFENIVKDGPVTVDGNTYNTIEEYVQHLVEANETVTTLVNNNDGTYTYTSEDGTVTTVDVPSDIVNQFGNIVNNGPVTVDGNTYNTIEEYVQHLVEANETVTTLINNNDGTYTYTSEDGTVTTVDVPSDIVNQFGNIVTDGPVTVDGNTYNTIEEYIEHIVSTAETTTTLVNNNDGTYTYTSEDGTVTTVDVPSDIVNQFGTIVTDGPVTVDGATYNTIEEYIEAVAKANETVTTLVNNNDGTFTYTNEAGTIVTFDANTTTMVDNGDGTYTFTNANGDTITIDSVGDIINNFEDFVTNSPVTVDGTTYTSVEEYFETIVTSNSDALVDNGDGTFTHTAADGTVVTFDANTTPMVDSDDGTYTFTNANGDTITIDSVGDIINNFEEFVTNNPVTVDGTT